MPRHVFALLCLARRPALSNPSLKCTETLTCDEVLTGPSTDGVTGVLVDPDFPDILHAVTTASEVYRSVDGGLSWELLVVGN